MNKRRLIKLADLLEADAKNKKGIKFDLSMWGAADDGEVSHSCGTAACAMGLAVITGAFKRAGLHNGSRDPQGIIPVVGDMVGYDAASTLFDIDNRAATFLFWEREYPEEFRRGAAAERFVAKRIRDFVAGKVRPE